MKYSNSIRIHASDSMDISSEKISEIFKIPGVYIESEENSKSESIKKDIDIIKEKKKNILEVEIICHDDGSIEFLNKKNGKTITDPSIINAVKNTESFKKGIKCVVKNRMIMYGRRRKNLVEISSFSMKTKPISFYRKEYEKKELDLHLKKTYRLSEIEMKKIENEIKKEAEKNIKTWKFWGIRKLRKQYVNNKKKIIYGNLRKEKENESFSLEEAESKIIENKRLQKKFIREKEILGKLLENDPESIKKCLDNWAESISFPFELYIEYTINDNKNNNEIDVVLYIPNIEEMLRFETKKSNEGNIKMNIRSKYEKKNDFMNFSYGLALFIVSRIYNIAISVSKISVLGYMNDEGENSNKGIRKCLYSLCFDRDKFCEINFSKEAKDICNDFILNEY